MPIASLINRKTDSNRDLRIDTIKGILIILVVFGHAIQPLFEQQPCKAIYTAIYSFHMPLFILVSGYVFSPSMNVRHYFRGILRLAETLLLFQGLRWLILFAHGELAVADLITPYKTYWYLLALIYWRSLAFLLLGCFKFKSAVLLPVSFVVALATGYIPISWQFTFQRTFVLFPFFLLGMYLRNNACSKRRLLQIGGGILLITSILWITLPPTYNEITHVFYYNTDYSIGGDIYLRAMCLAISLGITLLLFAKIPQTKWLAAIGMESLVIYIFHELFIEVFYHRFVDTGMIPDGIITSLTLTTVLVGGLFVFAKTDLSRRIINPLTYSRPSRA